MIPESSRTCRGWGRARGRRGPRPGDWFGAGPTRPTLTGGWRASVGTQRRSRTWPCPTSGPRRTGDEPRCAGWSSPMRQAGVCASCSTGHARCPCCPIGRRTSRRRTTRRTWRHARPRWSTSTRPIGGWAPPAADRTPCPLSNRAGSHRWRGRSAHRDETPGRTARRRPEAGPRGRASASTCGDATARKASASRGPGEADGVGSPTVVSSACRSMVASPAPFSDPAQSTAAETPSRRASPPAWCTGCAEVGEVGGIEDEVPGRPRPRTCP